MVFRFVIGRRVTGFPILVTLVNLIRAIGRRVGDEILRRATGAEGLLLLSVKDRLRERLTYVWLEPMQYFAARRRLSEMPPISAYPGRGRRRSVVDRYWSSHTVGFKSAIMSEAESLEYLDFFQSYAPLKHKLCGLYDKHSGETLLDYGCGPGNDLVGWALKSDAARIIGADISRRALHMARRRLALHHDVDPTRLTFQELSDVDPVLPFEDASIDYIHCLGVIHHVSNPLRTLEEFWRILRPGGKGRLMAYNAESIYVNLNIAYGWQILGNEFPNKAADEAFEMMADLGAPIALCRSPEYWVELCEQAGFRTAFLGAYYSVAETKAWEEISTQAIDDERLQSHHREFLKKVRLNAEGYPVIDGRPAGLSAVYMLEKPVAPCSGSSFRLRRPGN